MSWSESRALGASARQQLLAVAQAAIGQGLRGRQPRVDPDDYAEPLRAPRASFVTLHVDRQLRGCIGSLAARRPLILDVAYNAYAAAYQDPRFPALTWPEFERLDIHLSLLTAPEPVGFTSEADLIRQLRPGIDGLILEAGPYRSTFLPSVWAQVPEPRDFLRQLKCKAGLPADYWSASVKVERYTAESIP